MEAGSLQSLAYHAIDRDELGEATAMLREAFAIDRELGELPAIALDLLTLARVHLVAGDAPRAAMLLGRMRGMAQESGTHVEEAYADEYEAATREQLGDAAFAAAWERGRALSTEEAITLGFDNGDR